MKMIGLIRMFCLSFMLTIPFGQICAQDSQMARSVSLEIMHSNINPADVMECDASDTIMAYGVGVYKGKVINGKPTGVATIDYVEGGKYEGSWLNGQKNGQGTEYDKNGKLLYSGLWHNNKPLTKQIVMKWVLSPSTEGIYMGSVLGNVPYGYGVIALSNGDRYSGEWKNGQPEGYGTYLWKSGDVYKGEYVDGLRNGFGVYKWASGAWYEGNWFKNKQNGKGVEYKSDGSVFFNGEWGAGRPLR